MVVRPSRSSEHASRVTEQPNSPFIRQFVALSNLFMAEVRISAAKDVGARTVAEDQEIMFGAQARGTQ